jgi:hypothetical protein
MKRSAFRKRIAAEKAAHAKPLDSKSGWRFQLRPWMLVALVVAVLAVIRIRLLDTPLERDEGEYAYAGQLMLQGIPPYKLAFNMKFPGTYAAYAVIMAVFGQTIAGIHMGLMLVNAGAIVLIYLLGKRLFTPAGGVASSAVYALLSIGAGVLGTQGHATHFVVLAAVGGTLLLIRAIDTGRSWTLFWSGLLYGAAVLMKQHAVLFVAFGASYLIWDHLTQRRAEWPPMPRRLTLFFCGVSAPVGLTGLALWRAGVFAKFWFWTVTYAREYVLEMSLSNGIAVFRAILPRVVGPNFAIWMVALVGLALLWWKNQDRAAAVFVTGFLVFSFLAICPGLYFRQHYFVLILPAIALLAGSAVSSARKIWPAISWATYAVFGGALVFSVVQQQEFLFQMSPLEISRAMYSGNPFPEAIQISDYIRAHSANDARIAVLGSEPEIPFYAKRHSVTGHIYMYGLMEPQPYALTMQDEVIRDLETSHPDYVVFVTTPLSWLRRSDSPSRIFDWWTAYQPQHYEVVGTGDIAWVYKRMDLRSDQGGH